MWRVQWGHERLNERTSYIPLLFFPLSFNYSVRSLYSLPNILSYVSSCQKLPFFRERPILFPVKGPIFFPWNVILTTVQLQLPLPPSHMNDFTQRLVLIQRHKATLAEMGNCALLVLNAVSGSHRGRCTFLCGRVKDVFSESGHETEYRRSLADRFNPTTTMKSVPCDCF